jgi:prepilin-type N-terminal cleavage/methylation domain-containing protein
VGRARRGYTLLEMLLVLALLVILGALAYPSIDGMYGGVKLRAGADGVRGALMQARGHAIDETRAYRFAVIPGRGSYRVAPDSPDYWSGGDPPAPADPNNPPLVLEDKLPTGIVFVLGGGASGSGDAGSWAPVVTFLPEGPASADVDITIRLEGGRPLVVRVRAMTGTVSVVREGQP